MRALRTLTDALSLARACGNPRLELETALLRFILTAEDPTLDALAARVAALEEGGAPSARRAPAPARVATAAPPHAARVAPAEPPPAGGPVSLQRVRAAWQSIRGKVEGERQPLRALLSRAAIESLDDGALVLKLPDTWTADALRAHVPLIEAAIADVSGTPLRVVLRADGGGAAHRRKARRRAASHR